MVYPADLARFSFLVLVQVKEWVDSMVRDWKFKQIIPAHFAAPIKAGPSDLSKAFSFLDEIVIQSESLPKEVPGFLGFIQKPFGRLLTKASSSISVKVEDMKTLSTLDDLLVSLGAVRKTTRGKVK